jgi:hypothetical protein
VESYTNGLLKQIERLTRENAKLRTELTVTRLWNPPAELERAFQDARGWTCLSVPSTKGGPGPTMILVAGSAPGTEPLDAEAAGRVWRYLLTVAPIRGRIGPFARASMPAHLLGYLGEQDGREIIVLSTDLGHGELARAARMLWSEVKGRRPSPGRLLMSAAPLPILYALLRASGTKGALVAAVPAAAVVTFVALAPGQVPADPRPVPAPGSSSWHREHLERAEPGLPPSATDGPGTPRPSRPAAPTRRPDRPPGSIRAPSPGWSATPSAESPETSGTPSPSARPSPPESPSPSPTPAVPSAEETSPPVRG